MSHWTEDDSRLYRQIAAVAVPHRAEQLAALLALLPFAPTDSFHAIEIGAGEGYLSQALLACFPRATVTALDGSAEMRAHIERRLAGFGGRGRVEPFELTAANWRHHLKNADAVLSSLCLHHLSGPEKQALFAVIAANLSPVGALLIADLVEPQRPEARSFFAATWDAQAKAQSLAQTGDIGLYDQFEKNEWNLYRHPDPAVDKPSPLFEQLVWLKEAGLAVVDCFWLHAGHAIYGGYKSAASTGGAAPLAFEAALAAVQRSLGLTPAGSAD